MCIRDSGCTGAFISRSAVGSHLEQLTAGHCQAIVHRSWLTEFSNQSVHSIGLVNRSFFGPSGDAGVIRVYNPSGWRARAWVYVRGGSATVRKESYPIWAAGTAIPGTRVCMSGGSNPSTSCGRVTKVGVSVSYSTAHVLVSGLSQATLCARAGDSGSPVFAGHVAYGIVSGSGGDCLTWFQPVVPAARLLGTRLAVDRG